MILPNYLVSRSMSSFNLFTKLGLVVAHGQKLGYPVRNKPTVICDPLPDDYRCIYMDMSFVL